MLQAVGPELIIKMHDRFGVRVCIKLMSAFDQASSEFLIIVDLAVVDDPFCSVGIAYRLLPACQIDYRQPSHRKANIVFYVESVFVRAAVHDRAVHLLENAACTVLTVKLKDPFGYGRVIRGDGGFDRIVEQKDATDAESEVAEINSGIYCFDSRKLFAALSNVRTNNAQGEYYLTDVPRLLLDNDETVALFMHDRSVEVEGVNDRKQLASIEKMINDETIERLMKESGVTFIDPRNAYISSTTAIGRDTVIYPNVTIEGDTILGSNCVIRSGTRLSNATIGDNVEIRDNCLIIDSEVGDDCTVGPMAHLRGHAVMVEGAKVGNFVEMKKTRLGKNSKAAHLTYLGDATIGDETNIGAGVITCNYDGKNKHETHIGNDVKIGSDTMLVAPVNVGDGATTGAGSVVTKDVAAGELVVGVPAKTMKVLAKKD